MINTLLEHVPIKMEVKDVDETANNPTNDEVVDDDNTLSDIDEELDDEEDEEEESDIESDALEIEQEATMLISSDEEAELEAQRIRFPDVANSTKKLRKYSNNSSRSSSRNSQYSNTSSNTHITYEIVTRNVTMEETQDNKQRISPRLNNTQNNTTLETCNKENNNNTQTLLKYKKEKKKIENSTTLENNKNKQDEIDKHLEKSKTATAPDTHKKVEQLRKSPVNVPSQKIRRGSNNSVCSVASTVASVGAETESCGNIYVFNLQQKLIFNCEFCDLKYGDLDNFGRHLYETHKLFNLNEGPEKENALRNLPKTIRVTNNTTKSCAANVKKEPLQSLELMAEPPVALPPSVLAEPLDSCGNVFMLNHRKLFLVCGYCECKYANLDLFEKHLRQQHRIFEGCCNELNVIPKVEVKEEVLVANDVVDKTAAVIANQAMVAIPEDIPLNISTESAAETTLGASEEPEVEAEKPPETFTELDKAPATSSSPVLQTNPLNSKTDIEVENTVEANEISVTNENEKTEIVNNEVENSEKSSLENIVSNEIADPKETKNDETASLTKATRKRKRYLSPTTSKRPKRSTRYNTKVQKETATTNQDNKIPDKDAETAQVLEKNEEYITENAKESEDICMSSIAESIKDTNPENLERVESVIPQEIAETDTKVPREKTENGDKRKSRKAAQTKKRSSLKTRKNIKTAKPLETRAETIQKAKKGKEDAIKTTKPPPQALELKQEKLEVEECTIESQEFSDVGSKYNNTMRQKVLAHTNSLKIYGERHKTRKTYNCEICDKKFVHRSLLKKHTYAHASLKRFKCGICLRGYSSKQVLKQHIDRDHKPGEKIAKSKTKSARKQVDRIPKVEVETMPEKFSPISPSLIESLQETPLTQDSSTDRIMDQTQNRMTANELENGEVNTVTYTINALEPDSEETKKSLVVTPKQLNETESTVSGQQSQLLKVVKRFYCNECHSTFDKRIRLIEHKRLHTGEKPFKCDICGKQFRILLRLKEHKLRHSKEKKFICQICQLGCWTQHDLNQHMRHHTNDRRYRCTMCPKAFVRSSDLKIHVRVHTGEKPYVCEICNKSFRANQNLWVHKKYHMGESSKFYECQHCDKKFMRNIDLKVHMRSHTGEKPYKCEICKRGYSSKQTLKQHVARDHKRGEKLAKIKKKSDLIQVEPSPKVEIETMPELSTTSTSLIEPMQETPLTEDNNTTDDLNEDPVNDIIEQLQNEMIEKELENREVNSVMFTINAVVPEAEGTKKSLAVTPKIFDTQVSELESTSQKNELENGEVNTVTYTINALVPDSEETKKSLVVTPKQLNEMESTVSGQQSQLLKVVKRFYCNECHCTFDKRIRLIEHIRVHTGEKPFTCEECGKQFRIAIRLKEHKLRHAKEKKFICQICQLGCCTKQDLNQHMRHHTNDRRYQCTMCPKAFVRSSDLKIHIRVHTGEKPYICEICHKCFRANQNLCVHKKSHMGDASKIYKCEHCDKKFMRNIDRKVHMRSHTGEKPYKCEICDRGYSSKFNVRAHIERDHIAAKGTDDVAPKGKRKPGPKPKALKEELEKQKKLIEELRNQLWHQLKRDEKIIQSDEEILQAESLLQDSIAADNSPLSTMRGLNDPIQSAYELLNKLKSSTTTSKPLTAIPSPPPIAEPPTNPFTNPKKDSTTLLPLTITEKLEQLSSIPATSTSSTSVSCLTTPSPPPPPPSKTTSTKVVSQKTSLGIQQVSVTVSMQVENVTASSADTHEKDSADILTTCPNATNSPKKERKITSYFTVVGQKAEV